MTDGRRRLIWHGVLLILLGLASGVFIPVLTNSRMGLSAHLTGVQNGVLLVVFGLLWNEAKLTDRLAATTFWLLVCAMYVLWGATLLGAAFGTSRLTPIAGEGFAGSAWQEGIVALGLATGSVAVLVAIVCILYGLAQKGRAST
jgi:hydroxylaminobenzene mutase